MNIDFGPQHAPTKPTLNWNLTKTEKTSDMNQNQAVHELKNNRPDPDKTRTAPELSQN